MYYLSNHPRNFIEQIWVGDDNMIAHLKGKYFRRTIEQFFYELDMDNKERMVDYINNNYSCGFFKD